MKGASSVKTKRKGVDMVTLDTKQTLGVFQKHLAGLQVNGESSADTTPAAKTQKSDQVELSRNEVREAKAFGREIKDANEAIGLLQVASGAIRKVGKEEENLEWLGMAYHDENLTETQKQEIKSEIETITSAIQEKTSSTSFMGNNVFGQTISLSLPGVNIRTDLTPPDAAQVDFTDESSRNGYFQSLKGLNQEIAQTLGQISESLSTPSSNQGHDFNQFDPGYFKRLHGMA